MLSNGDSSSVVFYGAASVGLDVYVYFRAVSGECLVHGIIDDFINEVVQTTASAVSDVHVGTFSDGLDAAENLYVACIVTVIFNGFHFLLILLPRRFFSGLKLLLF